MQGSLSWWRGVNMREERKRYGETLLFVGQLATL